MVLFSTKKASAVLVPSGLIEDIEKGSLAEEEKETLIELDLVTLNADKEKQEMLEFIKELNVLNGTFILTAVLNLDCNLGCRYCFEGKRKGKFYMSDEIEDHIIDLVKRGDLSNKKDIRITFYGGEPLLSTERIVSISERIKSFVERKGLKYRFFLITNGTLLTPRVVERLAPLGLEGARVTLDGPEHIHDMFRPFKSGKGSFDAIVRNIKDVCDTIKVQLGGNFTEDHYKEFPALLDYLMDTGLTPDKIFNISFAPVVNESSEFALPDFHDGCNSLDEPWICDALLYLRGEILKRGYRTQKLVPSPCVVELYDCVVVNYDGALYKCPAFIGMKNYCVGDVKTGLIDYRGTHGLDVWKNEECLGCSYLPLCFGGCKYMRLLRDGHMRGLNCQKQFYDRTLSTLVSQDIKYDL